MPPDGERVAEARGWFVKAARDLRAAELELAAEPPLLGHVVFNAQQAAEKAMKGFLAWHDRPFRKTHNLVEIGRACAEIDPSLEELLREAAPLTEYAWRFRYPADPDQPLVEEAKGALSTAQRVVEGLVNALPAEVRPAAE